jgi:hypothetical protein
MAVPGTAVPGTSAGGMGLLYGGAARGAAPEGQLTATIYGMIKDGKYQEATRLLTIQLQNFPRSRAALSLLGYCFYQMQDYRSAAQVGAAAVRALLLATRQPRRPPLNPRRHTRSSSNSTRKQTATRSTTPRASTRLAYTQKPTVRACESTLSSTPSAC